MIPTVDDLVSSRLTHRPADTFNPPALTNFLGVAQADVDPVAIRCVSFPPFASEWAATGAVFLNGRYFASTGAPVTFTWYPDRIEREAVWDGWRISTTTALARQRNAVLISIEVRNVGPARPLDLRLALRGGVSKQTEPWRAPYPPGEKDNEPRLLDDGVAFVARASRAVWLQAGAPRPASVAPDAITWRAVEVRAGETASFHFVTVMDEHLDQARALADDMLATMPAELAAIRDDWNQELAAVFSPGNDRYGGSLPVLETADEDVARIYAMGALGVVYFKRDTPASFIGRTYDTLMPAYWQTSTFLWDYSISGVVHALLDPGVMKGHLEHWMATDVHTCFGTEWLTGSAMGGWYSVNDYAMTRMITDYLRWTGDRAWLDARVDQDMTVREHLRRFATNWEQFRTPSGLADYGGIGNLLECVSTYVHEIAALNAGNVWSLRAAADLVGDAASAQRMRAQADELVSEIRKLYADGKGYWCTRFPDGSLVPVQHCYDFNTLMATIPEDLSARQRDEMAEHCLREYRTPNWMRALSVNDPDAVYSTRPDHQWNGAYTAWPAQAIAGLYRAGRADAGFDWLKDLVATTNQGPIGQAHFVEEFEPFDAGGARKAPAWFPYITDWSCSSNGSWVQLVIESIFGVRADVDGTIAAEPAFGRFDPDARLRGLRYQGALYTVDRNGLTRA